MLVHVCVGNAVSMARRSHIIRAAGLHTSERDLHNHSGMNSRALYHRAGFQQVVDQPLHYNYHNAYVTVTQLWQ